MPTFTTDIDFDLDGVDDYDLINELECRGYEIIEKSREDYDLIDILEARGYSVYGKGHKPNIVRVYLEELYNTFQTMPPEFFEKELKKFFRVHLDVSEY